MDDYFVMRSHVPPFGSWDCGEYLPFTQCFETARQGGLLRYTCEDEQEGVDSGDLYVTGDLYQNDAVTPAVIFVPRSRSKENQTKLRPANAKQAKKQSRYESKHPSNAHNCNVTPSPMRYAKPVDEDLYKISPELLRNNAKKTRRLGFFASCCLGPTCST
ncbi:unnamed protein product [Rhodiola kirilowii]